MEPLPIIEKPALKIGKTLVIADLHIGFEIELWRQGIKIPFQTSRIIAEVNEILEKEKLKKVVVNGDLKHEIAFSRGKQAMEIEKFLNEVKAEVEVVQGNHDGGLSIEMHPASGILMGNIGIFHGHAYPNKELLEAKYWITAHLHPMFGFRDTYGRIYKEPCWIVGRANEEFLEKRYGEAKKIKIIVMPAFSPIVGGLPVNLNGMSGVIASLLTSPSFFLLDGTEVVFENEEEFK